MVGNYLDEIAMNYMHKDFLAFVNFNLNEIGPSKRLEMNGP